ncbi:MULTISPECIES: DUF4097 family beta strand repeat-containing protein [Streptomyces]|uniref:DUF4097 family beta strand repeat-containing protein n=1 Tax=Streptomyces TaxID=1883 RepID=UPI001E411C76|nr:MULTISPECIES: hypothetical protein [Streptomyces]UFQ18003.1 hypothetical protein J2N69_25065 [Streptomyces huasconensis]WCL87614.1 hypothetical protein PPN52_25065 [Streptomyces sp. JCM 35825]
MSEWSVAEPRKLTFDAPVTALHVRLVNGMVHVVGTDEDTARLEVSEIEGPPLTVTQKDGVLSVAYDDLPWKGFRKLKGLAQKGWWHRAVVSLAVPAGARVEVGAIGAGAMVSGIEGPVEVRSVTGDMTLVGLTGPVNAETMSGGVEAQGVCGDLGFRSVSGDLTMVEAAGASVRADSVSGALIVDLTPTGTPADLALTNISGEIAVRLPHPADTEVEVETTSGAVSSAFEELRVSGGAQGWGWGTKRVTGRLGAGGGSLRATTVSGAVALLRRPPMEEDPYDEVPLDVAPSDSPDADVPPQPPAAPTHKKVL